MTSNLPGMHTSIWVGSHVQQVRHYAGHPTFGRMQEGRLPCARVDAGRQEYYTIKGK